MRGLARRAALGAAAAAAAAAERARAAARASPAALGPLRARERKLAHPRGNAARAQPALDEGRQSKLEGAAMLAGLQMEQQAAAAATVRWFVNNMPDNYFEDLSEATVRRHMSAVSSLFPNAVTQGKPAFQRSLSGRVAAPGEQAAVAPSQLERVSLIEDESATFITPHDAPGLLSVLLDQLSATTTLGSHNLRSAGCYNSHDGSIAITTFQFDDEVAPQKLPPAPAEVETRLAALGLEGDDGVGVTVEHHPDDPNRHTLHVAVLNVVSRLGLKRVASYLAQRGLNIEQISMEQYCRAGKGEVLLLHISLEQRRARQRGWDVLCEEAKRAVKWVDDRTLELCDSNNLTLIEGEMVHALTAMQHGRLAKKDPFAYALSRLYRMVASPNALPVAHSIARLVLDRFDPAAPLSESTYQRRHAEVAAEVEAVSPEDHREVLAGMLGAADAVLRTNAYARNRFALGLRLKPEYMGHGTVGESTPYGTFFVSGRRFRGYHVRFRDIARGGLRVVTPVSEERHAIESGRQYDEVYNLAFAQQLKNKDIPEGGAKAVVLLEPDKSDELIPDKYGHSFMARKSVRAFTDALLDLLLPSEDSVDLLGKDELVYLGPDEQIVPEDIEWITARAALRGYPTPNAFMSSKPAAGINHKDYGVTSEGVAVFLGKALEAIREEKAERGEETTDHFTIKLTGGTDGDVAGNMLKILDREYGARARVVGICDATASAEDADGLPMDELLRLVHSGLPLKEFNAERLGPNGELHFASTPEGARMRDTMHERIEADAFVPAGGRPNTINAGNVDNFLRVDGAPSSPLICEAANLFITPEARQKLFEAGAFVIKDSSANKCGVICSSYEIIASMMLSEEEFLQKKEQLVQDVLVRLRDAAAKEATLLLRERARDPSVAPPMISQRISGAITAAHDATLAALEGEMGSLDSATEERMIRLAAQKHLPEVLATPEMLDRLMERVPQTYKRNILAATAAATLVYEQGLVFAEGLGGEATLYKAATRHLTALKQVADLADSVAAGKKLSEEDAETVARLLRTGGARSAIFMGA